LLPRSYLRQSRERQASMVFHQSASAPASGLAVL